MLIEFDRIPEEALEHFKGGEGVLYAKTFSDPHIRLLRGRLAPGSTIGLHTHRGSSEVICILSGTGRILYDGGYELLGPGSCHYCPPEHEHSLINDGRTDLCFFAVVPNYRPAP